MGFTLSPHTQLDAWSLDVTHITHGPKYSHRSTLAVTKQPSIEECLKVAREMSSVLDYAMRSVKPEVRVKP